MSDDNDQNTQRTLGRIEAELNSLARTLTRVDRRSEKRDELLDEVISRVSAVETAAVKFADSAEKITKFEKAFEDIKLQSRAFVLGVAFAGGMAATGLGYVAQAVWKTIN
jgi:uncharacterized protein YpiB (UPF0302 family)